ncbi:DUF885 domain-containing protein [Leeuwenhoekiella marinoflava]|uniref:DUF885 domain-containing protein n=2 Tax=Leeuwenhoekiella marinoflava TaxID=988 RepID=A0A4V1KQZ9_9FLAO|nr:DUF885 domain-containing protein [Leeuwenhoekiella marinoflava]RXG23172.1 putative protein (DUF885 family) [Leeuwenhoekiella marinoflava]SHF95588.1 Uncharacterized conserved protein, DUF885 familyt [Leeuwenhoekiella marinoflava DSM 3653]
MKNCTVFLLVFFSIATAKAQQTVSLDSIISEYQQHRDYDWQDYPLGRYDEDLPKERAQFAKSLLNQLKAIDLKELNKSETISYKLLSFILQDKIDEYTYKMDLNPIQADQGFHLNLNYQVRPIHSYNQALGYLKRLKAIPYFTQSHFELMRKGFEEGIVQPRIIFKGYESTYETHIVDNPTDSYFYSPFLDLPETIPQERKDSLLKAAKQVVADSVIPSFKKIKAFFETEYMTNSRDAIGVSAQPGGAEFYQNRINFYTTSKEYTAKSIHELGLSEVARIKSQMQGIIEEVGFEGSFSDFLKFLRTDDQFYVKTGDALLMHARDIAKRIDNELPAFFSRLPRQPYGVIKVPDAIAPKYTGGRYSGSSINGTQAGHYLVNTYQLESRPLYTLPSLTAHEAVPGHHLQGALNQEISDDIPQFRKDLYLSAYGEGWGLYSEYLADEMGIYRTPYEKFGQLTYEMWRACRLVVDTGIHAMGWTRQEVVDYMSENTALSIHEVNTETDRYIAWPGQALSYKIGELKIRELRERAKKTLGEDFDIRAFHNVILEEGTVTLPILEERVDAYITKAIAETKK